MPCTAGCPDDLPERWWQDPPTLETVMANHPTFVHAGNAHGIAQSTISKWAVRHGFEPRPPGPKAGTAGGDRGTSEDVELTVERADQVDAELRRRGLNPAEWVVVRVTINRYQGFVKNPDGKAEHVPLEQLKVTLRPRLSTLVRPAAVTARPLPKPRPPDTRKPRLVLFLGDEQAPYHDQTLHQLTLRWLAHNRPAEAVHLGDLCDFPTISRHRPNPAWNATPQECVDAGHAILRAYREAAPDTRWRALPGNHDERLRDYQLRTAAALYGLRPADVEAEAPAALSLPALLRLEDLGVEWLGGEGDYEHDQADVTPTLAARHGFVTGANSADKTVRRLGLNVVVGHTHRQRVHYVTEERMRETLTMVCVEAGCMCKVDGGLGYVVNPDWAAGFATAQVWPDGSFTVEHAVYRDGVLRWRDQAYS